MPRRGIAIGLALAALAVLGIVGWSIAQARARRQLRAELDRAVQAVRQGRLSTAHRLLTQLAANWPRDDEVAYRLGECALARGERDAALAALALVPRRSPFFAASSAIQADQFINMGQYTKSESVLDAANGIKIADADTDAANALARARSRLYRFEGRVDDVRRTLRDSLPLAPDPAAVLRELWLLDNSPLPVQAWQVALEHADGDDDRVRLGRANLAIVLGHYDEARKWLDQCAQRRPDDPAVRRARLDLARAAGDAAALWEAARHVPAAALTAAETLTIRAELARAAADPAEFQAWQDVVQEDPGNTNAWERLATLAEQAGRQPDAAAAARRRKAESDQAKDRFRTLILDVSTLRDHAAELASLAATLGRPFDAHAWKQISAGQPVRPEPSRSTTNTSTTLAAALTRLGAATSGGLATASGPTATPPRFRDDAEAAGLRFTFDNGASALHLLPETMSGGVGILDYDGDGWADLYVVQGGPLTANAATTNTGDRLFRNRGDGTFEDVTESSRIADLPRGYGLGVTVGDYDNDGDPDLFITRLDTYALFRNRGDGTFEDATEPSGLSGRRDNPTSAAFADLDNDGDLDLYVCHYMIWDPEHPRLCHHENGEYLYCDPSKVDPAPDHVFRNDAGRFVDVTNEAGFVDPDGRSLGVIACDLDADGLIDLYVANDGTANFLFHNKGGFRFEEVAHVAGVAGSADGGYQAGMGVACGDIDGDGLPDLLVTNFYGEATTFYRNLDGLHFSDQTAASGLGLASRFLLGFGIDLIDYDNDTRRDILAVNGHVNDQRPYYPYAMPALLMANLGGGRLTNVSRAAGMPWDLPRVGRGLATGDLDHDGRVDALVLSQNQPLAYFHNQTPGGHFVMLRLEGTTSNRDAVGARVRLESGDQTQVAWRVGGGSYQSANDGRMHFGLGPADRVQALEIQWPSGHVDRLRDLPGDTGWLLREGDPTPRPLAGFTVKPLTTDQEATSATRAGCDD